MIFGTDATTPAPIARGLYQRIPKHVWWGMHVEPEFGSQKGQENKVNPGYKAGSGTLDYTSPCLQNEKKKKNTKKNPLNPLDPQGATLQGGLSPSSVLPHFQGLTHLPRGSYSRCFLSPLPCFPSEKSPVSPIPPVS